MSSHVGNVKIRRAWVVIVDGENKKKYILFYY